jgi:chaperonin GroES
MNSKIKKITPMKGRVVVLPDPAPEKTESGLFIPEAAKKSPDSGVVTHISDSEPLFKKGAHVLFVKNAGMELDVDGVTHILMKEEDIYATV